MTQPINLHPPSTTNHASQTISAVSVHLLRSSWLFLSTPHSRSFPLPPSPILSSPTLLLAPPLPSSNPTLQPLLQPTAALLCTSHRAVASFAADAAPSASHARLAAIDVPILLPSLSCRLHPSAVPGTESCGTRFWVTVWWLSPKLPSAYFGCAGARPAHHLDLALNLGLGVAGSLAGGRREMSRGRSPEPLDFFIWTVEVLICSVRWFFSLLFLLLLEC